MVRKLVVVGLPCIFPTGSVSQLFFGVLVCFLTWGILLYVRPYERASDGLIASTSQFSLFCTIGASMLLKTNSDSPVIDGVLTTLLLAPLVIAVASEVGIDTSASWIGNALSRRTATLRNRAVALFDRFNSTEPRQAVASDEPQPNDSTTSPSEPNLDDVGDAPAPQPAIQPPDAKKKATGLRARLQKSGAKKGAAKKGAAEKGGSALTSADEPAAAYASDAPAISSAAPPSLAPAATPPEGASPRLLTPADIACEVAPPAASEPSMMFSAGTSIGPFASELIGRFSPSSSKPPSQERRMDALRAAGAVPARAEDKYDA